MPSLKHHQNDMKAAAGASGKSDHLSTSPKNMAEPVQTYSEPPASAEWLPLELGGTAPIPLDLAGQDAALGARLLPAAVAVIAGFRQTVVLDLIERAIALIAPPKSDDATLPTPPSEPI